MNVRRKCIHSEKTNGRNK